jgi:O-antigen ligase/tetratricopeptide (TPR) repeat protein
LARLGAWAALALLTTYLIFFGGGWAGLYVVQIRIASTILATAAIAAWLIVAYRRPDWRPQTQLWPAFVAALTSLTIAQATSSHPRYGADYLAYSVILTALYLLLQRLLAHAFFRPRLLALATAAGFALGITYLVVILKDWITWWAIVGHIAAPPLRPMFESLLYGNPSAVMTIVLLFAAAGVGNLGSGSPRRRALSVALIAISVLVTILSGSRAGWLGVGIAVAVTGGALLVARRPAVAELVRSRAGRAGLIGSVVLLGVAAIALAPGVLSRLSSGGEFWRQTFFAVAWKMFAASPVVGLGPGTWPALRTTWTAADQADYYIPHPHNIYLETLAEQGIVGAIAGVVVIALLVKLIVGAVRDPDPDRRRWGWIALFTTTYFGAHQLLDVYANMSAILFAYVIPIALLDASAPGRLVPQMATSWARPLSRAAIGALVLALAASAAWLARSEGPALSMDRGVQLANAEDWAAALPEFRKAVAEDPDLPPYQLALGVAAANVGNLEEARAALSVAATEDDLPTAWVDLASVELQLGDEAAAREDLTNALRLGRQQAGVLLAAAHVYGVLGELQRAQELTTAAFVLQPAMAAATPRDGDPLALVWDQAVNDAVHLAEPVAALDIAVSANDLELASRVLPAIADQDTRAISQLAVAAWSGDRTAAADLVARARADPLNIPIVVWAGRVAERQGDENLARDLRTWGDMLVGGTGASALRLEMTRGSDAVGVAGLLSQFHGHYAYRRPTPWDQLILELPHVAYR